MSPAVDPAVEAAEQEAAKAPRPRFKVGRDRRPCATCGNAPGLFDCPACDRSGGSDPVPSRADPRVLD